MVYAHVRDVKCYMRLEVVVTDAGRTDGRSGVVIPDDKRRTETVSLSGSIAYCRLAERPRRN